MAEGKKRKQGVATISTESLEGHRALNQGLELVRAEGAGEVQTPLKGAAADRVGVMAAAAADRRCRAERVDTLAHLLVGLHEGRALALDPRHAPSCRVLLAYYERTNDKARAAELRAKLAALGPGP